MSDDVMVAIHQKNRAKHAAEKTEDAVDFSIYKKMKNSLKSMIPSANLAYLYELLQKSHKFSHVAAQLWSQVNAVIGRQSASKVSSVGGNLSLEAINVFFFSFCGHYTSFVSPPATVPTWFQFCMIAVLDVLAQLRKLDVRKATRPDGISARFLRSAAEKLANPLTYIFNLSLQSGTIPSAWKRSNVTPVHKGGSCDDPGNFRPISVVPVTAKFLEKLISFQLSSYRIMGCFMIIRELTDVDIQQIKLYYLLQILSLALLIRDLQFVLHSWISGKRLIPWTMLSFWIDFTN